MGLSSSQARLLSITARLTSNEYESQQISNAKMRLATQTQEASEAYISALNNTNYSFVTYDSMGNTNKVPLTAAVIYEYADNKNQYIITNSAGKALVSNLDYQNYQKSNNLNDFLKCYGITKTFQTETLKDGYEYCVETNLKDKLEWEAAIENYKSSYSEETWRTEKINQQLDYMTKLNEYTVAVSQREDGKDISITDISLKQVAMEDAKKAFTDLVSYRSAIESKLIAAQSTDGIPNSGSAYEKYVEYQNKQALYNDELERLGLSPNSAYQYDDKTKAQWYTNLWYKMNGESTDKSGLNNCAVLNPASSTDTSAANSELSTIRNLATMESTTWISDALQKGLINIEMANYKETPMTLQDESNPFKFNLNGISWDYKIYSACPDIVEADNDKLIAQAEAEYTRKTTEINAKDEKYQRKLNLLDTEHSAIEKEYDSVKSAMDKNIDRSFKVFQG